MNSKLLEANHTIFELKKEITLLKNNNRLLYNENKRFNKKIEEYDKKKEIEIDLIVKKAVIEATSQFQTLLNNANNKIAKLEAKLNVDYTNSNLPKSQNPICKKTISNLREKTDKSIGGQVNHHKHELLPFKEEEITEHIESKLCSCSKCQSKNITSISSYKSDVLDYKITISKIRYTIHKYKCNDCHYIFSSNKELYPNKITYGRNVKATALELLNDMNVPYNKISKYFNGITNGEVFPKESYLVKIQHKYSDELNMFLESLKKEIVSDLKVIHWDDTTIKIGTKQGIIRFYGDEKYALLIAHESKSKETVDEDNILSSLSKSKVVVHDHLLLNYNDDYEFKNAECNSHILRYLKQVKDNMPKHTWQDKLSELLKRVNSDRKGKENFDKEYQEKTSKEYDDILKLGLKENEREYDYLYYKTDEYNLLKRLNKFKEEHLLFMYDFDVPFTNNIAEKSFRIAKTKMKVSGLFQNIKSASDYTNILSYIETCYRNNISKYDALLRLVDGKPYTIEELKNH